MTYPSPIWLTIVLLAHHALVRWRRAGSSIRSITPRPTTQATLAGLLGALLFSTVAAADGTPPGAVAHLRVIQYSPTVAEVFWDAARDPDGHVARYRLERDGVLVWQRDARSHFEPSLESDRTYRYQVRAIDNQGNRGPVSEIILRGEDDPSSAPPAPPAAPGTPAPPPEQPGRPPNPTTPPAPPPSGDKPGLAVTSSDLDLEEGLRLTLPVTVTGARSGHPVTLSLSGRTDDDERELQWRFDRNDITQAQATVQLSLDLSVARAPIMPHTRTLRLLADDGQQRNVLQLRVQITPTSAPDVYLLTGQSNMEGYSERGSKQAGPGGQDEPHSRIHQLNVQANSRSIFAHDGDFTNERKNINEPVFVSAEDPLHEPLWPGQNRKGGDFVGLSLSFAKALLPHTTQDVYLVPAAWGATGFCGVPMGNLAWNARPSNHPDIGGNLLTERALTRLNMTLRESGGVFRGILWHQGGADANNATCRERYADNLQRLVERLRTDARRDARGAQARGPDADIPFVLATQSFGADSRQNYNPGDPGRRGIDAIQRRVTDYVPWSGWVNNDDLVPPAYPCGQSSCVHFGAAALREQGRRMAAELRSLGTR